MSLSRSIRHTSQMHAEGSILLTLTNGTGGARVAGDRVVFDPTTPLQFVSATASNSQLPQGILRENIAAGSNGQVVFGGYAPRFQALGTAQAGDFLYASGTAYKSAHMAGNPQPGAFGYVLSGGSNYNPSAYLFGAPHR